MSKQKTSVSKKVKPAPIVFMVIILLALLASTITQAVIISSGKMEGMLSAIVLRYSGLGLFALFIFMLIFVGSNLTLMMLAIGLLVIVCVLPILEIIVAEIILSTNSFENSTLPLEIYDKITRI